VAVPGTAYVAAALIAAGAALIGLILSKEQKTTEFRQSWIKEQRTDLSTVIAHLRKQAQEPGDKRTRIDVKVEAALIRLHLRDNPNKHEWSGVLQKVAAARDLLSGVRPSQQDISHLLDTAIVEARVLLKTEWNRVRQGEASYRHARRILPFVIFVIGAALAYGERFLVVQARPATLTI
jgi:hypothetical protein